MKNDYIYIDMLGFPIAIIKPTYRKIKIGKKRYLNKVYCLIESEDFKRFKEGENDNYEK